MAPNRFFCVGLCLTGPVLFCPYGMGLLLVAFCLLLLFWYLFWNLVALMARFQPPQIPTHQDSNHLAHSQNSCHCNCPASLYYQRSYYYFYSYPHPYPSFSSFFD